MTAPSENVSMKLNTTVYENVVLKNICKKQADPLFHVGRKKESKRNQRTFRIDKIV